MYPSSPNKYPIAPKAYPTAPNEFPGASAARWPTGGAVKNPVQALGASLGKWIEGSMGITTVNGATGGPNDAGWTITNLLDQGPNAYNVFSSGAAEPMHEKLGWAGAFPSWQFDGVNDELANSDIGTGAHAVALAAGSFGIWIAAQTLATALQVLYSVGNTGLTTNFLEVFTQAGDIDVSRRDTPGPQKTAVGTWSNDKKRHCWYIEKNGSTVAISKMDQGQTTFTALTMTATDVSGAAITVNKDRHGALGRNADSAFSQHREAAFVSCIGLPTAQQKSDMEKYMSKFMVNQTRPQAVIWGDSVSLRAGPPTQSTTGWSETICTTLTGTDFVMAATGGESLGTGSPTGLSKENSWVLSTLDLNRSVRVIVQHYGINDIAGGRTAVQVDADDQTAIDAILAADPNAKIVLCTLHACGTLTGIPGTLQDGERLSLNTKRLARASASIIILDKAAIITEAATDTSVFVGDTVHLNNTGNGYIANGRNGKPGMLSILQSLGCS